MTQSCVIATPADIGTTPDSTLTPPQGPFRVSPPGRTCGELGEVSVPSRGLLQYVDALLGAHVFEDLGPHRDRDLAQVGLLQQHHVGAGLADAAADR